MRVEQRVTRNVVTIGPEESLKRAVALMRGQHIRHLPVVEGKRLVGIVTDRDLREAGGSALRAVGSPTTPTTLDRLAVSGIMTREVITATPELPVEEAARLLVQHKIGCLPVVRADEVVGILTPAICWRSWWR